MSHILKATFYFDSVCYINQNKKSNPNYHPKLDKKHKTNKTNNSKNSPDKPRNKPRQRREVNTGVQIHQN